MCKKLAVFPFDRSVCPLARYNELLTDYTLSALLTPRYMHLGGADISKLDGGSDTGIYISDYNTDAIDSCDVVFIPYSHFIKNVSAYREVISYAKDKELIISKELKRALPDLHDLACIGDRMGCISAEVNDNRLYDIDVPVISVMNSGDFCDGFNVELTLRKYFTERGYRVSQISSKDYGVLFGLSTLPNFMFKDIAAEDKIVMFNHYIRDLVKKEKPDLLIIGVSDAIAKYNNKILNGLGITPFIIMNAVKTDIGILNVYYYEFMSQYFENLIQFCKHRLSSVVEYFNISNTSIIPPSTEEKIIGYITLNSDYIKKRVDFSMGSEDYKLFNVFDREKADEICQSIEQSLLSNIQKL